MAEEKSTAAKPRLTLLVFLGVATALMLYVVWPIAEALLCSAILASVLWPPSLWLAKRLGGRQAASAAIMVALLVVVVLGPVLAFSALALREVGSGLAFLFDTLRTGGPPAFLNYFPKSLVDIWQAAFAQVPARVELELLTSLRQQLSAQGGNAAMVLGATLTATGAATVQMALFLVSLYFFLLEGSELVAWVEAELPLERGHFRELIVEFKKVASSIVVSSMVTSGVQAAAALLGYWVTRLPYAGFFTVATFFCAFVPAFGAAGICFIAALLLFITGHPYAALFLVIWGIAVVGTVDNLIRPLLIRTGLHINGALVFFALMGGLGAFGAIGLILGPLSVSLFLALLRIFKRDFGVGRKSVLEKVSGS